MNHKSLILLFFLASSCVGVSKSDLTRAKTVVISKEQFSANPFGFDLTLENFEQQYGKILKRQRYFLASPVNESYTDTIYKFHKGKTEVLFYKPMKLNAKLMAGNIFHPEIKLKNDIHTGLTRKEFFWKFSDWTYDSSETVTLNSPATGCSFIFVFSRDKLKTIRISNKLTDNE